MLQTEQSRKEGLCEPLIAKLVSYPHLETSRIGQISKDEPELLKIIKTMML
jgi:hypothetical protein